MLLKLKISGLQLLLFMTFFLFGNKSNAQGQYLNDVYATARNYYNNGQYQYVYSTLTPHVEAMKNGNNFSYYKSTQDGVGMVFRVYKMIVESEYAMNQIARAEWFENWVINYFRGIYTPEQVYDYLEYAQL